MRLSASTVRKRTGKVDGAVEMQRTVRVDVDVEGFVIGRGVDEADVAGLYKVIGDDDVFLIGRDFDVVGSDGGLDFVGVVEALYVVEVGNVKGSNVVCRCECHCGVKGGATISYEIQECTEQVE
jgi:hypothetical protein